MYEAKFPEVDQVVMVQVKSIAEMGAYVQLLEYNNIEGMILLSELTRRRIRSVSKLIKVGRIEPVMVLRVDKEKGYIDLSKRRVSPEDVAACEEKYNKSKMVHSIVRHTAETTPATLGDLYEHMAWPLAAKYGHCFEAFKHMVGDPDKVLDELKKPDGTPAVDATVKNASGEGHSPAHDPAAAQDPRRRGADVLRVRRGAAHQGGDARGGGGVHGGVQG